jgi:hypothetical protein
VWGDIMGDENIKAILERAAVNPAYLRALLCDREAALRDMGLEPHELAMLLSVPDDQLRRMVKQARTRPLLQSPIVRLGCYTAVAAAALAVVTPSLLRGIRPEVMEEMDAKSFLYMVAEAEKKYKLDYGQYGSLEDLRKRGLEWPYNRHEEKYIFKVTIQGNAFTASARHKERPQTRRSFVVGPDGEVKELPREDK